MTKSIIQHHQRQLPFVARSLIITVAFMTENSAILLLLLPGCLCRQGLP